MFIASLMLLIRGYVFRMTTGGVMFIRSFSIIVQLI